MKKFEYKFIEYHELNRDCEELLNNYGEMGWEIVGYSSDIIYLTEVNEGHHFILKREKNNE